MGAAAATPYDASVEDEYYDADADASYAFGYSADESNKEETADAEGNIVGSYSYVDAAGVTRTLNYRCVLWQKLIQFQLHVCLSFTNGFFRAGAGIGFVPEADFLPYDPAVEAARAAHFESKRVLGAASAGQ